MSQQKQVVNDTHNFKKDKSKTPEENKPLKKSHPCS